MKIFKFIFNLITVIVGALVGNWVGEKWRSLEVGDSEHELTFVEEDEQGEITVAVNPLMTNFLPAVILGLLTWPSGWGLSFVVGVLTARFLGDRYEDQFEELLSELFEKSGIQLTTGEADAADLPGE
jgi:hypothetical protein